MTIAIELLCVVEECLLVRLFLQSRYVSKGISKVWEIIGFLLFGAGVSALSLIPTVSFLRLGFFAVGVAVLALRFYSTKFLGAVFSSVIFCTICVLSEAVVIAIMSIWHLSTEALMQHGSARAVCLIMTHVLMLAIFMVVLAFSKHNKSAVNFKLLLLLSPGWAVSLIFGCIVYRQILETGQDTTGATLLIGMGLLYLNVLVLFYSERIRQLAAAAQEQALEAHHYEMQKEYYEQLHLEQEDTRAMMHDIQKYLLAMKNLVENNNTEEANRVQSAAQEVFDGLDTVVDLDNRTVSVVLNEYIQQAKNLGIMVNLDAHIPPVLSIATADLYILLGNTLDNAIEACSSLPTEERRIDLQMRQHHDVLFYRITNPVAPGYRDRSNDKNHGYGLKNVRHCVEKYSGDMEIERANGKFTVSLRLTCPADT